MWINKRLLSTLRKNITAGIESGLLATCSPFTAAVEAAAGAAYYRAGSAASGALTSMLTVGCARLGQIILEEGGKSFGDPISFRNVVVPAIVGTGIIFGGIDAIAGFISGMSRAFSR